MTGWLSAAGSAGATLDKPLSAVMVGEYEMGAASYMSDTGRVFNAATGVLVNVMDNNFQATRPGGGNTQADSVYQVPTAIFTHDFIAANQALGFPFTVKAVIASNDASRYQTVAALAANGLYATIAGLKPNLVVLDLGFRDLTTSGRTLAQVQTDLTAIIKFLRGKGILVLLQTHAFDSSVSTGWAGGPDYGIPGPGNKADVFRAVLDLNSWMLNYAATHGGVFCFDRHAYIQDPASTAHGVRASAGGVRYATSGTAYATPGARATATALAKILTQFDAVTARDYKPLASDQATVIFAGYAGTLTGLSSYNATPGSANGPVKVNADAQFPTGSHYLNGIQIGAGGWVQRQTNLGNNSSLNNVQVSFRFSTWATSGQTIALLFGGYAVLIAMATQTATLYALASWPAAGQAFTASNLGAAIASGACPISTANHGNHYVSRITSGVLSFYAANANTTVFAGVALTLGDYLTAPGNTYVGLAVLNTSGNSNNFFGQFHITAPVSGGNALPVDPCFSASFVSPPAWWAGITGTIPAWVAAYNSDWQANNLTAVSSAAARADGAGNSWQLACTATGVAGFGMTFYMPTAPVPGRVYQLAATILLNGKTGSNAVCPWIGLNMSGQGGKWREYKAGMDADTAGNNTPQVAQFGYADNMTDEIEYRTPMFKALPGDDAEWAIILAASTNGACGFTVAFHNVRLIDVTDIYNQM